MGVSDALSRGAIRFTLGHGTTQADVERAVAVVPPLVAAVQHPG
jgi:cysteine sulfinate desulfinase/cysteine desulfurase-like protein